MTRIGHAVAILLTLAFGFGLAACGSDSDSDAGGDPKLEGIEWKLVNIGSDQGWATSLPNTVEPPTIEFDDGQVQVFAGCNSGSGEAAIGDGNVDIGPVAMTRKACNEAANQIEQLIMPVLSGEVAYSFKDGNLSLDRAGYTLVFVNE